VGVVKRGKEVVKPWVSRGVSFGTFLSLMKEKYKHSRKIKHERVNPSVTAYAVPPPFTQGRLWIQHLKNLILYTMGTLVLYCPKRRCPL